MRLNIVFFAVGIWLLQQQAELPGAYGVGLLSALGLGALLLRGRAGIVGVARVLLVNGLCLGAGFYWAAAVAHVRIADALPPEWEGRDIQIRGIVASMPQPYERSVRFDFVVETVMTERATVPRRVALGWWGTPARDGSPATFPEVHAGERWQLTVRLRRPRGTANPNGFDYEAWLLERDIRAVGYVRARSGNRRLAATVHEPRYWIERARGALRERVQRTLSDAPYSGVIAALAIGDQRAIPLEQWQVFTRTGVNHLMSISGLHVTMVSGLAFALAYWLWRRSSRLVLRLPARRAAALAGFLAALLYTLLAGFAVPAQRTLYMLAVAAISLWLGRTSSVSTVLAAALFVVLVLDPWAVLAAGFWLSFGAVALIMYVTVGRLEQPHWLVNWAKAQWAVTLGLIPPLLALFQQVSVVSPFANALAIPVISLVVVPLTLIGVVLPLDFMLQAAHGVMAWCMVALEWLGALPHAFWEQHAPHRWAVAAAAIGAAWLLLPRGVPARWLGAVAALPLFLLPPAPPAEEELRLTVLDVGQGLSVVAQTRRHALLYDAGPSFGPGADSGNRIIVPYLRASGIRRLDGLIISHDDIDHTGGAVSVLHALPTEWLLTSLPDMDPLVVATDGALRCRSGLDWEWDGVRFEILHPPHAAYDDARTKDNDRSCVLMIHTRAGRILVPADVERRAEAQLLAAHGDRVFADVLVAPHQGSKTSSTPHFVERVKPRAVIFPVGYRNRFGHPNQEVVDRYRATGSRIYRTDRDGALTLIFSAAGSIRIEPYRAVYRRYWQTALVDDPVADAQEF